MNNTRPSQFNQLKKKCPSVNIPAIPEMRFVLARETNALMKTFFEIITLNNLIL